MKFKTIIEAITKAFPRVKTGGEKDDPKLAALDRGVLTVALLVAALDGTILPEEFAAFRTLAKKCRGGTAKNVQALVDETLPVVGRLMVMAQIGIYTEKELLAAFLSSAEKVLPHGFEEGSLADVRRAFALWVIAGVADGKFSHIEKEAVSALEGHYAVARAESCGLDCGRDVSSRQNKEGKSLSRRDEDVASTRNDVASTGHGKRSQKSNFCLLEPDFLAKAEKIAQDLAVPAKKEKAEAALDQLISIVETVDDKGDKIVNSSAGIAVNLAMMAMIGFAAAMTHRVM